MKIYQLDNEIESFDQQLESLGAEELSETEVMALCGGRNEVTPYVVIPGFINTRGLTK